MQLNDAWLGRCSPLTEDEASTALSTESGGFLAWPASPGPKLSGQHTNQAVSKGPGRHLLLILQPKNPGRRIPRGQQPYQPSPARLFPSALNIRSRVRSHTHANTADAGTVHTDKEHPVREKKNAGLIQVSLHRIWVGLARLIEVLLPSRAVFRTLWPAGAHQAVGKAP